MEPVDLRRHDSSQTLAIASFTLSLALHAGAVVALSRADFFDASTTAGRSTLATEALLVVPPAITTQPPPPPPPEPPPANEPPPPPPEDDQTVRPGIDDSAANTPNWLGFSQATPHSGERSTIEQSALSPAPGSPAPQGPSRPAAEPTPEATQPGVITPPSPPPAPTEPAQPASPGTRPTPDDRPAAAVAQGDGRKPAPEPIATPAATPPDNPTPQPIATPPQPAPNTAATEPPESQPREGLEETSPAGIEPRAVPPAPPQASPPPGTGPAPLEPQGQRAEPAPPSPQPSPAPGTPPPPAAEARGSAPGLLSDAESVAAALQEAIDVKPGKVLAAKGLRIQTVRPEWAVTTRLMARPKNPVVKVTFGRNGRVIKAEFVEGQGTGWSDVDGPLKDALYRWTARGSTLDQLPASPGPGGEPRGVALTFRVILSNDDTPLQR